MSENYLSLDQIKFQSKTLDEKAIIERRDFILEHIRKHDKAFTLVQKALSSGPFSVFFYNKSLQIGKNLLTNEAYCDQFAREIVITCYMDDAQLLEFFIFEVCNLVNEEFSQYLLSFQNLMQKERLKDFLEKFPDPIEFAKKAEILEYPTRTMASKIIAEGITMKGWPEQKNDLVSIRNYCSWELYLLLVLNLVKKDQNELSHFQSYMLMYYEAVEIIIKAEFLQETDPEKLDYLSKQSKHFQVDMNNMVKSPQTHLYSLKETLKKDQYLKFESPEEMLYFYKAKKTHSISKPLMASLAVCAFSLVWDHFCGPYKKM